MKCSICINLRFINSLLFQMLKIYYFKIKTGVSQAFENKNVVLNSSKY